MGVDDDDNPKEHIRVWDYFGSVERAVSRLIHIKIDRQDQTKRLAGYISELARLSESYKK